jgi:hypothetical protein
VGRFVGAGRGDQIEQALLFDLVQIVFVLYRASPDRGDVFSVGLGVWAELDTGMTHAKRIARAAAIPSFISSHRVFSKISRPISMRRISLVPAPIS